MNTFLKNILKFEDKEFKTAYNKALKKYNQYLKIEYSKCKFIPGFKLLIKKLKKFKKIVISGSNQKELKYIFKKEKYIIYLIIFMEVLKVNFTMQNY